MNSSVGSKNPGEFRIKVTVIIIADNTTRLFDNYAAAGHVPWPQSRLPVTVNPAAGKIRQVKRSGAYLADSLLIGTPDSKQNTIFIVILSSIDHFNYYLLVQEKIFGNSFFYSRR